MVCPLATLRSGPNSTRQSSFLNPRISSTYISVVPSYSGWGPAHGCSWDGIRWHSVNMPNLPPSSLLYLEMASIPVLPWSSALDILFGQKMCRILLRHLFRNTSSIHIWHIPLVTFYDAGAYTAVLSSLVLNMISLF